MNILYITQGISKQNGWGTYTAHLIESAKEEGHNVAVVTENQSIASKDSGVHSLDIQLKKLFWNPFHVFRTALQLRKVIRDFQPDVIHVTVEPFIMPFAFLTHKRVVLTIHGTYAVLPETISNPLKRYISRLLFKKALGRTSAVVSVSKKTREKFLNYLDFDPHRVHVVPVVVDFPFRAPTADKYRQPLHIITVGEVKKRKGIHNTIDLFSAWAEKEKCSIVYDVVGSYDRKSPYVKDLTEQITKTASDFFKVVLHGRVDEETKAMLLAQATLYVHLENVEIGAVDVEGFGIGILEAASYGVPALVKENSATVEAVVDGKTGYIVKSNEEIGTVYSKLEKLLLNSPFLFADLQAWVKEHDRRYQFKKLRTIYEG